MTVAVMVFTRDLRLADNPALAAAARAGGRVVPLFVLDEAILRRTAGLPAAVIHDPDEPTRRARRYPPPIVDHRQAIAAHRARRH